MSKDKSAPAFPCLSEPTGYWKGMSLRDWFAGQALMGRMLNGFASSADADVHARAAYRMADAMLTERSKP